MNIAVQSRVRGYIYTAVLLLALVSGLVGLSSGGRQDRDYQNQYRRYQQASALIGQGQYASARDMLGNLDPHFQTTYQVQYRLGLCAAGMGDYGQAVLYMQKVQELRPAILQDQSFLVDFGRILFYRGDWELARSYLLESQKYGAGNEAAVQAGQLLEQIARQGGGNRP